MKDKPILIHRHFPFLPEALRREMDAEGMLKTFAAGEELLREGQYVKAIPIVFEGLICQGSNLPAAQKTGIRRLHPPAPPRPDRNCIKIMHGW